MTVPPNSQATKEEVEAFQKQNLNKLIFSMTFTRIVYVIKSCFFKDFQKQVM